MKKVKNIYLETDQRKRSGTDHTGTGLFLELEDGSIWRHQSNSFVLPFERVLVTPNEPTLRNIKNAEDREKAQTDMPGRGDEPGLY